jgi:hypothetical protein
MPAANRIYIDSPEAVDDVLVKVNFVTAAGQLAAEFSNRNNAQRVDISPGPNELLVQIPELDLLPQKYYISFSLIRGVSDHLFWCRHVREIQVSGRQTGHQNYQLRGRIDNQVSARPHASAWTGGTE